MTHQIKKIPTPHLAVTLLEGELQRVEKQTRFRKTLFHTVFLLVIVAAIAILFSVLFFPVLRVFGASMSPVLQEGDMVIAVKTEHIRPGELVAFYYGNKVLIKRCIASGGDTIDIDANGNVFVNDQLLEEPYLIEKSKGECDQEFPFRVPDGRIFVMGDQREISVDSRNSQIGCIPPEQIIGKIILRIWPLDRICFHFKR